MSNALKSRLWHRFQGEPGRQGGSGGFWRLEIIIPLLVIALLLALKAWVMAIVAAAVTATLWVVRAVSEPARRRVDAALGGLAHWVGQIVATVLLAPVFYLVMVLVRLLNRLAGKDPLQLRHPDAPTFWLPSDLDRRRTRYLKSMFCTERLAHGQFALLPVLLLGVVLLAAAELGLRLYGFGTPLLVVQDPTVGYYPKPNQRVRYPGRIITINNCSMRSPDLAPHKAPGHFRILLLGDSTLAGTWVGDQEIYSAILDRKLNQASAGPVIEVLNMGVNGWGPFHELGYVKKFGTFEADVAVILGPVGDCRRPLYGLEREGFTPATHPPRLALEQILYELCWRYRERCLGPRPWQIGDAIEGQLRLGVQAYVDLARYLQQQGAEVVIEMMPAKYDMLGEATDTISRGVFAQLANQVEPLGVPANCAGQIFKDVKPQSKVYHDAVHFDRLGHRLYADYLYGRLTQASSRLQHVLKHP
jgi:hypothetical protein